MRPAITFFNIQLSNSRDHWQYTSEILILYYHFSEKKTMIICKLYRSASFSIILHIM